MSALLHWHAWFSIIHILHKEMQFQKSLSLDANGEKRDQELIRKLLQMTKCSSIRDVSLEPNKVRNALCEELWLEKETDKVC